MLKALAAWTGRHPLATFIARRVLSMVPIVLITVFFFFFFMDLAPGDYFTNYSQDPEIGAEIADRYRREFGLDQPFWVQYGMWLKKVIIDHDLGMSFSYRQPILDLVGPRLGNTLLLNLVSLFFTFAFSYPIAFYFAYRPRRLLNKAFNFLTLFFYSIPSFFLALLGLLLASATGWFPLNGATSVNHDSLSFWGQIADRLHHVILPVLVGFVGGLAGTVRSMKVLLSDEFHKPYMVAMEARGIHGRKLVLHAFRNALIPFITGLSDIFAGLISGSLFVEIIFSYPGIGRLMYEATLRQDYFLVLTNMVIGNLLILAGILLSDILLAIADPRVRMK